MTTENQRSLVSIVFVLVILHNTKAADNKDNRPRLRKCRPKQTPCREGQIEDNSRPGCCIQCVLPCEKGYELNFECGDDTDCTKCPGKKINTHVPYNTNCKLCETSPIPFASEDGYRCINCPDCKSMGRPEKLECKPWQMGKCEDKCINKRYILPPNSPVCIRNPGYRETPVKTTVSPSSQEATHAKVSIIAAMGKEEGENSDIKTFGIFILILLAIIIIIIILAIVGGFFWQRRKSSENNVIVTNESSSKENYETAQDSTTNIENAPLLITNSHKQQLQDHMAVIEVPNSVEINRNPRTANNDKVNSDCSCSSDTKISVINENVPLLKTNCHKQLLEENIKVNEEQISVEIHRNTNTADNGNVTSGCSSDTLDKTNPTNETYVEESSVETKEASNSLHFEIFPEGDKKNEAVPYFNNHVVAPPACNLSVTESVEAAHLSNSNDDLIANQPTVGSLRNLYPAQPRRTRHVSMSAYETLMEADLNLNSRSGRRRHVSMSDSIKEQGTRRTRTFSDSDER